MSPEGSLPHSQVPATCPYPKPPPSSPYPFIPLPEDPTLYYHSSIYAWVLQVESFPQISPTKPYIRPSFPLVRTTCPVHLILLELIAWTLLRWGVQIIKLLIMQFFPLPCYLVPLRLKYSHHPFLKHPQPAFLPHCERPSFTLIHNRQNYSSVYLNLKIFEQ